jgi:hypothetical protein
MIIHFMFSFFARPYLSNIVYTLLSFIFINIAFIYMIIISYKYYRNYTLEPEFKFYVKFKSYLLRNYILKNMVCPDCNGVICVHNAICYSCGRSFEQ